MRARPERTCVGCRARAPKADLVRIVRGPGGVAVDPGGTAPGRGAYVHPDRECVRAAGRGFLARALRTRLDEGRTATLMEDVIEAAGVRR